MTQFSALLHRLMSIEFNFYSDALFWVYLAAIVVVVRLLPARGRMNDLLLLVANALMLLAIPRFNAAALLMYCSLAMLTYGIAAVLNTNRIVDKRGRIALAATGIGVALFILAVFKYRFFQELIFQNRSLLGYGAADFVFLVGISYVSFKAIHVMVEAYKGTLKNLSFPQLLNYLLFFPSFISGPINRYNDFYEHSARAKQSSFRDDLRPGLERIIHGLFKKFVLTVILFPHTIVHTSTPLDQQAPWQILLGLYAYALYFYFDFSGYTDLAIGGGRLLGFKLPENFNRPFLKKNIQQLWANWHMSLTGWLTDYVYWPLVRKLRNSETLRKHPLAISNAAILITFFLCGAWHGESANFLLWGLYHGLGIAAVNTYQKWKRQVRQPAVIKYFASPWSYGVGVFLTFNFFSMGLLFLLKVEQVKSVLGRLFG